MARGRNIPGMDPRMMNRLKKQVKTEELDVTEVVMKLPGRTLVFRNPAVTAMDVMGQKTYQVIGEPEEMAGGTGEGPAIPLEDIKLVAERAGVSEAEARTALKKTDGDIAEAIIELMG